VDKNEQHMLQGIESRLDTIIELMKPLQPREETRAEKLWGFFNHFGIIATIVAAYPFGIFIYNVVKEVVKWISH
jgi:hypothetical protein